MQPYHFRRCRKLDDEHVIHPIKSLNLDTIEEYAKGEPTLKEATYFQNAINMSSRAWVDCGTRVSITATLENINDEKLKKVTKIIAFGSGSMWQEFRRSGSYYARIAQHAVINDIQTYIENKFNHQVENMRKILNIPYKMRRMFSSC